jgi:deoxyribodipyrimidine photo-lyase
MMAETIKNKSVTTTILWFRRDLRLRDNPAFNWALDNSDSILPIYIHAVEEEVPWQAGGASRWWLHHSLQALDKQLRDHGLKLHFFSGESNKVLSKIIDKTGADSLSFNKLYEPHLYSRDQQLEQKLAADVQLMSFDSGLFFSPGTVLNNQQLPYRVFTPFYNKIRPLLDPGRDYVAVDLSNERLKQVTSPVIDFDVPLHDLALLDDFSWHEKLHQHWQPGENKAHSLIDDFLDDAVQSYQTGREVPSVAGTSRMSPYLHFGEITPQQIYHSLQPWLVGAGSSEAERSAEVFLKQLIWREFAHNVLWHFPHTATEPMDRRFSDSFWDYDEDDFQAWCRGETGIPIIDAGMKQLWETGWMHNRVRMIVSSFLTKNLGIHWLHGARWFWDTLVDADLANNSMGWQWVAGCGVDAAPYYRIFNPETQAKRFDSSLKYIDAWLPDYNELDYPAPIVDLAGSRAIALQRYKQNITSQEFSK